MKNPQIKQNPTKHFFSHIHKNKLIFIFFPSFFSSTYHNRLSQLVPLVVLHMPLQTPQFC